MDCLFEGIHTELLVRLGMAVFAFKGETRLQRCISSWCIVGRDIFGQGPLVFLCSLLPHPTLSQPGNKIQVLTLHLNPLTILRLLENKASPVCVCVSHKASPGSQAFLALLLGI